MYASFQTDDNAQISKTIIVPIGHPLVVPMGVVHVVFQVVLVAKSLEADRTGHRLPVHMHPCNVSFHVGRKFRRVSANFACQNLVA